MKPLKVSFSLCLLGLTEPFNNKTTHNAPVTKIVLIMMLTHWHWIFLHDSNIVPQAWNIVFVWFKWKSAPLLLYCTCLYEPRRVFLYQEFERWWNPALSAGAQLRTSNKWLRFFFCAYLKISFVLQTTTNNSISLEKNLLGKWNIFKHVKNYLYQKLTADTHNRFTLNITLTSSKLKDC